MRAEWTSGIADAGCPALSGDYRSDKSEYRRVPPERGNEESSSIYSIKPLKNKGKMK